MSSSSRTAVHSLPTFLVIGAMKAGTTSLYHYVRAHPQVFMPPIKELDFFVEEANWRRGLQWYRKQFDAARLDVVAVGEASTAYSKYPVIRGVPQRIADCLPHVRLVYVVRDPIERIRSHYEHRVAVGSESTPLAQAILENPIYLSCSRYGLQVEQYLAFIPRERLLIITSEDLRSARQQTIRRVYEFLGVDSSFRPETLDQEFYPTTGRARLSPTAWRLRSTLKRYIPASKRAKEFIDSRLPQSLSRILGRPLIEQARFRVGHQLRAQIADLLRDDVRRLRTYMPEGFEGWGID